MCPLRDGLNRYNRTCIGSGICSVGSKGPQGCRRKISHIHWYQQQPQPEWLIYGWVASFMLMERLIRAANVFPIFCCPVVENPCNLQPAHQAALTFHPFAQLILHNKRINKPMFVYWTYTPTLRDSHVSFYACRMPVINIDSLSRASTLAAMRCAKAKMVMQIWNSPTGCQVSRVANESAVAVNKWAADGRAGCPAQVRFDKVFVLLSICPVRLSALGMMLMLTSVSSI